MNLDRYKNIVKLPIQYKAIKIVTYLPTPIEFDYKKGYITRYFLQKANDINSPIYEVKQNAMMKYDSNSFYRYDYIYQIFYNFIKYNLDNLN